MLPSGGDVTMLTRVMRARTTARGAVLGLTAVVLMLAVLAFESTGSAVRATTDIKALEAIDHRWDKVFEAVSEEQTAAHEYGRAQDRATLQRMEETIGRATPELLWLTRHHGVDTAAAKNVVSLYATYNSALSSFVAATYTSDTMRVSQDAARLGRTGENVIALVGANTTKARSDILIYLENVARHNRDLRQSAMYALGGALSMIVLLSIVLLSHQRRVERQADEAEQHLAALRASTEREHEVQMARAALEVELRHAQKLESVGSLAAGIAHEINTPVQFVADNLRFLDESFADLNGLVAAYRSILKNVEDLQPSERHRAVEQAEAGADLEFLSREVPGALAQSVDGIARVAQIVRSMKAFGHPDQAAKEQVDLNAAIADTLVVANSELKHTADVDVHYGDLPLVWGFGGDLNQVWLNLLVNAAHAIQGAARETGVITVRTRVDGLDVVVEISDNGTGIPDSAAARVFDPFFTTKGVGKGTGQGLALARSVVVDRHQGSLTFDTVAGEGTTFRIRLPIGPVAPDDVAEILETAATLVPAAAW
ncbi:MAG: sensor histidine kinase [Actinomycetia bacterium]|nr:sensor histidine kinase [Actinomycetes bacterium]